MPFMFVAGECVSCHCLITFSPSHVPSIRVNGSREPLCVACFTRWNELHRVSKGLEPVEAHPLAWTAEEVA